MIEGGVPLRGDVRISGSKNSALPCLFATLLTDQECVLENVPRLEDIRTTCSLLEHLGKEVEREGHTVRVRKGRKLNAEAPYDLVRRMRASALVLGPLLARMGRAAASLPGGCAIGVRPIDIHLKGFESLGAKTELSEGMVRLKARKLKGCRIEFSFASVGATENLLMAAVLAEGETVLENVAREPEIVDLANFLRSMGAGIEGAGSRTILVRGKKSLSGARHRIIPDRIEAATYLISAAVTRGKVRVLGAVPEHFEAVLRELRKAGLEIREECPSEPGRVQWISCAWKKTVKPVSVVTETYPGFPTDVQAQWMALMSLAKGSSTIEESIFENRFLHAAELLRMGALIAIEDRRANITGVPKLSGADVMVSDLRAGAAMVLAGLAAKGQTAIHRIYHLDRGYEDLEAKFRKLGARIKRARE